MTSISCRKLAVFAYASAILGLGASAAPSINDVQGCQAVLDFVEKRVAGNPAYDAADVKVITEGVAAYDSFLQEKHIDPGLMQYTQGNAEAAANFQKQIDLYKAGLVRSMEGRFAGPRIYSDQAVAISNCYIKAPMDAAGEAKMKAVVDTIIKLARAG